HEDVVPERPGGRAGRRRALHPDGDGDGRGHPPPSPGSERGRRGSSPRVSRPPWSAKSRSSTVGVPAGPTRSRRTADTLYSGIFDSGSRARLVSWLAARVPAQWYGMNTVSGRMVATTLAGSVM